MFTIFSIKDNQYLVITYMGDIIRYSDNAVVHSNVGYNLRMYRNGLNYIINYL